ncbi:MAG TPA: hypothetical protein H9757_11255 [Candidatus Mediterraneibacter faecigallinarum]|uniref:Uncharacterized protein n=1 Tax=Candidatus Mediterraneibacter faecigallinarum TaxID=2838669 RepID=A0A9D2NZD8_9FIRM|nr:hypothetical protein [Candidatus Mediterraneibacter faecigallinarum]
MRNKKLQEVAAKITEMLEENEKKKEEAAGEISASKQLHKEAVEVISEAFSKSDVEGYHKAQDAARQAKDITEMYQGRKNRLGVSRFKTTWTREVEREALRWAEEELEYI